MFDSQKILLTYAAIILSTISLSSFAKDATITPYAELQGNAENGRFVFAKCRTCHFIEPYMGHYNGPWLYDIFNKEVGTQDFEYSPVLTQAKFQWSPETLYFWLSYPDTFLPNSQMVFAPFENDQEKADLIEYMKIFTKK